MTSTDWFEIIVGVLLLVIAIGVWAR